MSPISLYHSYLESAIQMAKAAGEVHLKYFRSQKLNISTKLNSSDVVTIADKEAEQLIVGYIHSNYPSHGIIAEESGSEHADQEWRWVIDPLDGTTNFSQGLPVFSVSIALEHHGDPVIGVVYAPYFGELFHAIKGQGAFFNGKPIGCSKKTLLSEAVIATGIPYDKRENPDNNIFEVSKIAPLVRGLRRLGSAALDLAYVGAGFFDAYWELNLKHWDIAAGTLIASEGGAKLFHLRENRNFSILMSCPGICNEVLGILLTPEFKSIGS